MSVRIGIIGGSGLYDMAELTDRVEKTLTTPFGDPSGPYVLATLRGKRVAFLARHGKGHRLNPSELNYRANIFGMKMLGVEWIMSEASRRSGRMGGWCRGFPTPGTSPIGPSGRTRRIPTNATAPAISKRTSCP